MNFGRRVLISFLGIAGKFHFLTFFFSFHFVYLLGENCWFGGGKWVRNKGEEKENKERREKDLTIHSRKQLYHLQNIIWTRHVLNIPANIAENWTLFFSFSFNSFLINLNASISIHFFVAFNLLFENTRT